MGTPRSTSYNTGCPVFLEGESMGDMILQKLQEKQVASVLDVAMSATIRSGFRPSTG